ncbi:MAG: radical SAM protein [Theionarchaea archaeon]|nr:radical SAM protein [Theionarchaea archaeon]
MNIASAPLLVEWLVSETCNLKCAFCSSSHYTDQKKKLSPEEVVNFAHHLVDLQVFSVIVSGGEPLMHPQVFDVINILSQGGIMVSVPTNGTLIDSAAIQKLKESGVGAVQISIDGKDEKTHDTIRGVKGTFKKAVKALKELVQSGVPTGGSTTVSQQNIDQIPDIAHLLSELGVGNYNVRACMPCGRAGPEYRDMAPPPEQWRNALASLDDLGKSAGLNVVSMDPLQIPLTPPLPERVAGGFLSCGVGRTGCAVGPDGTVTPCAYIEEVAGTITEESLKDIWCFSPVLQKYRSKETMIGGKCKTCQWSITCGGGCKARSYGVYRDISQPDPLCWLT